MKRASNKQNGTSAHSHLGPLSHAGYGYERRSRGRGRRSETEATPSAD